MENIQDRRKKIKKRKVILIIVDVFIVLFSFLFFIWLKPATLRVYLPAYWKPFLLFEIVWLLVSLIIDKYDFHKAKKPKDVLAPIIIANLTIFAVITTTVYSLLSVSFSRSIVFGTILFSTILELVFGYIYFSYKKPVIVPEFDETKIKKPTYYPIDETFVSDKKEETKYIENREQIVNIIIKETSENVYNSISKYIDVGNPKNLLVSTTTKFNIDKLPANTYKSITNLHKINDIRRINKFFESVNTKLPYGGIFINSAETYTLRKERILSKYPPVLNYINYFFDYIFTRAFPKLPVTKNFYFYVTLGRDRVLSRAETLGRLYSCGFDCIDEKYIDGQLYFIVRKIKEPAFDYNPTYGPLIKLKRYGKGGKAIGVYKMRTMHAYSEYLQEYVYQKNKLQDGGKFYNDFRVTAAGKILRKLWLDELPNLINYVKGEMKLVGVRPLSKQYFNLYTEELKEKRLRYKPGLIPPFYVDMPKTLEEIMDSENKYLDAYEKHPFLTDTEYFFKALYNIFFRKVKRNY